MTWDYDTTEYQKQAQADPKRHLESGHFWNSYCGINIFKLFTREELKDFFNSEAKKLSPLVIS